MEPQDRTRTIGEVRRSRNKSLVASEEVFAEEFQVLGKNFVKKSAIR
ncbi:hypothetical protein LINPERHAP1_LOCUS15364, partial [Linum perenne]